MGIRGRKAIIQGVNAQQAPLLHQIEIKLVEQAIIVISLLHQVPPISSFRSVSSIKSPPLWTLSILTMNLQK